jgi:diguanylate cyclase (GGDEF)-like protein
MIGKLIQGGKAGTGKMIGKLIQGGKAGTGKIGKLLRMDISETAIELAAGPISITVSMGISEGQPGDEHLNDLLKRADSALYTAKNGGRNRVVIHQ